MTENDQLPGQARDKCKDHQQKAVFSQDGNVMLKAPVFGTRNAFCRQTRPFAKTHSGQTQLHFLKFP